MSIVLKGVSKTLARDTHIYPTDLRLEEGSFNVLLGTTLAGKTTLMRLMAGLERPSSGELWFQGKNITGIPVQKRSVSMVYQQFINYPSMTVFDNIASPLRLMRLDSAAIKDRVELIAKLLKLSSLLDRYPKNLSGGQQQRTALARALVKESELILLDEPLANLDYKLREELRDELPKLVEKTGSIVVYATSEPSEALLLGGSTVSMFEGRVTQCGPAHDLYLQPVNIISADTYSEPPMNKAYIKKTGSEFVWNGNVRWPVPEDIAWIEDDDYIMGLRPHHLSLAPTSSQSIAVPGEVRIAEITGSESIIHATISSQFWVSLSHGVHRFSVGEIVKFFMSLDHCFYFYTDGRRIQTTH